MREESRTRTNEELLGRVKNLDDQDAWAQFVALYTNVIRKQALKAGLTDDETQEVTQETMIELSRRIQTFQYNRRKGSFRAWIFRLADWRIKDQFRRRREGHVSWDMLISEDDHGATEIEEPSVIPAELAELDDSWLTEWRQELVPLALAKLRDEIPGKRFQVLDLILVKHWSTTKVARLFHQSRASIYVMKFRAMLALKNELARLEKELSPPTTGTPPPITFARCDVWKCRVTKGRRLCEKIFPHFL